VAKFLLGLDPAAANQRDCDGKTPLELAVENSRLDSNWIPAHSSSQPISEILIKHYADLDGTDPNGQTLLMRAAIRGQEWLIHLLIAQGASINLKDKDGRTALSYAAETNRNILWYLLRAGANPNSKDRRNRTPLIFAARLGGLAIAHLLLEEEGIEADAKDDWGQTALSYAALVGDELLAKWLLDREDVDPHSVDIIGQTPFAYAASGRHATEVTHKNIARMLAGRGCTMPVGCDPSHKPQEKYWSKQRRHENDRWPPGRFIDYAAELG
jgi:ankyrin repeat protein